MIESDRDYVAKYVHAALAQAFRSAASHWLEDIAGEDCLRAVAEEQEKTVEALRDNPPLPDVACSVVMPLPPIPTLSVAYVEGQWWIDRVGRSDSEAAWKLYEMVRSLHAALVRERQARERVG